MYSAGPSTRIDFLERANSVILAGGTFLKYFAVSALKSLRTTGLLSLSQWRIITLLSSSLVLIRLLCVAMKSWPFCVSAIFRTNFLRFTWLKCVSGSSSKITSTFEPECSKAKSVLIKICFPVPLLSMLISSSYIIKLFSKSVATLLFSPKV